MTPRRRAFLATLTIVAVGLAALGVHELSLPPRRLWVLATKGYLVGGLPGSWFTNTPWRISCSPGGAQLEGWRARSFGMVDDASWPRRPTARAQAPWHVSRLDLVCDDDNQPGLWASIRERLGMSAAPIWAYVPTGEAVDIDGTTWRELERQ